MNGGGEDGLDVWKIEEGDRYQFSSFPWCCYFCCMIVSRSKILELLFTMPASS